VGFGTPVPLLVGIILILLGVGLFFLENFKPGYKRDSDTVYSILFLTVGILSLLTWSAGFVEALQLMVSAGTLIALMIERLQTRNPNNIQGRQSDNGPYRDDPRPTRPNRPSYRGGYDDMPRSDVRAEIDNEFIPASDDFANVRRIRGSRGGTGRDVYAQDVYQSESYQPDPYQQDPYVDQLSEDTRGSKRTGRRSSRSNENDAPYGEERSRRRPLQLGDEGAENQGFIDNFSAVEPVTSRRRNRSSESSEAEVSTSARSGKRRRPRPNIDRPTDGEYVDYKPLNTPKHPGDGDEFDNSSNFDDDPQFN
jgi:hypothetical protein